MSPEKSVDRRWVEGGSPLADRDHAGGLGAGDEVLVGLGAVDVGAADRRSVALAVSLVAPVEVSLVDRRAAGVTGAGDERSVDARPIQFGATDRRADLGDPKRPLLAQ